MIVFEYGGSYVSKNPDVMGGVACCESTRIPVSLVLEMRPDKMEPGYERDSPDFYECAYRYAELHPEEMDNGD